MHVGYLMKVEEKAGLKQYLGLVILMQGHLDKNLGVVIPPEVWRRIEDSIIGLQVMPSMRALMTAGPALERENISGYNCSYIPIDSPRSFDEILYILMNGTGVGFSVEREGVSKLPTIPDREFEHTEDVISVADSKEGWARAFRDLISFLYTNRVPKDRRQ